MKNLKRDQRKPKNFGPLLTKQEPLVDSDINHIVARYAKTGIVPGNPSRPRFGDFTGPGFQEMRNAIADIDTQFLSLPPKVRKTFSNDPGNLIRWVNDPANQAEAVKMGLISRPAGEDDPFEPEPSVRPPKGPDEEPPKK